MNFAHNVSLRRRGVAVASAVAVAVSGLAFSGSAQAAPSTVTVSNGDIRPDSNTYAGWHQGYADRPNASAITSKGLQSIGKSQILLGFNDNTNSGLTSTGVNADLGEDLVGASYDVTEGEAFLQVPLFADVDGAGQGEAIFTTLRPAVGATRSTTVGANDQWISSKAIGTVAANTPKPLSEIIAAIKVGTYKTIGIGVLTDQGKTSTVRSIRFDDKTYAFTPDSAAATVRNSQLKGEETASTYTSWHQGYDNATKNARITAAGLELAGKSQVIKGLSNNGANVNRVNVNLPFALPDSSFTVTEGTAFFQIPVFFDNGSGVKFATLRSQGKGVGTHKLSLDDAWQSSKNLGDIPAHTNASLGAIVDALGAYKVIGYGALSNQGDSATVSAITFDGTTTTFKDAPGAGSAELVVGDAIAGDASSYTGWHQGAETGTATVTGTGLDLGAARSQVIKGYANNSKTLNDSNVNLAEALRTGSYSVARGAAHFQIPMFFEDPSTGSTEFTTLRPHAPSRMGVNTFGLADLWASSRAIPGVAGAGEPVQLATLLSGITNYKVLAFGVYADAGASAVVNGISWDGVNYTFGQATTAVRASAVSSTTTAKAVTVNTMVSVTSNAPEASVVGGTVTVSDGVKTLARVDAVAGTVNIPVGKLGAGTRTLKVAFSGTSSTKPSSATVKVVVAKVKTSLSAKSASSKVTTKTKVKIDVVAKATGADTTGAKVTIKRGSKTLGTGKIKNGKVRISIGKLPKGTQSLKVNVYSTATASSATKTIKVKVKK